MYTVRLKQGEESGRKGEWGFQTPNLRTLYAYVYFVVTFYYRCNYLQLAGGNFWVREEKYQWILFAHLTTSGKRMK